VLCSTHRGATNQDKADSDVGLFLYLRNRNMLHK